MVRIVEPVETCCELNLFLIFYKHFYDLGETLQDFQLVTVVYLSRKTIFIKNLYGEFVFSRLRDFGVEGEKDGEFNSEFIKWYTWWNEWMKTLTSYDAAILKQKIDPYTGEMGLDDVLTYRPSGRWQDIGV